MKIIKTFMALLLALTLGFVGCKPKDADIKANVETALKSNPEASAISVSVTDAIATLSGEVKESASKTTAETMAAGAKGVKSVVNNIMVAMPVADAPVMIAPTDALTAGVRDATKDFPTVTAAVDSMGVVTLTGTIAKDKRIALMQAISALRPKRIENKLTIK